MPDAESAASPSPNEERTPDEAQILREFRDQYGSTSLIRFQWQDYSGVLRARVYLLDTAIARVAEGKRLKASTTALNCTIDSRVLPTSRHDGAHWLIPYWSSLRPSANPEQAIVMCALEYTRIGRPMTGELCPRQALERMLGQAREIWDLAFWVGFEVEFMVMSTCEATDRLVPQSRGLGHFAVSGLRDECFQYVAECMRIMQIQGVSFGDVHSEGCRGQYEIILEPLPPLEAVDQLVLVHDTLKEVFSRNGYTVTMSPKPIASDWEANGQHTHISLQPARPDIEEHFLAGILRRLPSLCAFLLPQDTSYERLQPYFAGDAVCWGTESRVVPIRKVKPSHWDFRLVDATANMYIGLAALLGAGLLGVESSEPLRWPDRGLRENQGVALGDPLPRSLAEALGELDTASDGLDSFLGRPLVDGYAEMKRYENSRTTGLSSYEVRKLLAEIF